MFRSIVSACCAAALVVPAAFAQDDEGKALPKPESTEQRVSYSIGQNIGQNLKRDDIDLNMDYFIQGITDAIEGADSQLTDEEVQAAMMELQQQLQAKRQAQGEENKAAGEAFLAENVDKEGIKSTDSGLQYEVIEEGDGPKPKPTDTVTVHYTGTLLDGTVFDSSMERGQPATFPLNRVIPGWTEGVQLMSPGAKYKFYIPSDLAYGPQGSPPTIPPNSTLIFEVELISVEEGGQAGGQPQVQIQQ